MRKLELQDHVRRDIDRLEASQDRLETRKLDRRVL